MCEIAGITETRYSPDEPGSVLERMGKTLVAFQLGWNQFFDRPSFSIP